MVELDRPPPVPPLVALADGNDEYLAYLLAWMRAEDGTWMAHVTWPLTYPPGPGSLAPTVVRRVQWIRAQALTRITGQDYSHVPRIRGVWRPFEMPLGDPRDH